MPGWTDPDWREQVDAWVSASLERLGAVPAGQPELEHERPWSTVVRVPTSGGNVYFKAPATGLRHEVALVTHLASRSPALMPVLLATDLDRGWMLMADAGTRLRELIASERDLARWHEVLPLYASLQLDVAGEAETFLSFGVPDLRLARLSARVEEMLDDTADLSPDERTRLVQALPQVREMCGELAAYGLPETIQHDDFHDGQIFVRDGAYRLLDWGDACVSHPFFSMAVTLEGVIAWGVDDVEGSVDVTPFRDAYLERFAHSYGRADLAAACTLAMRLGWVARAVNVHRTGTQPGGVGVRVRMFLDGRA